MVILTLVIKSFLTIRTIKCSMHVPVRWEATQLTQWQETKAEGAKWNSALIHFISIFIP